MLKLRQFHNRLTFNTGIAIPGKDSLYIEGAIYDTRASAAMVLVDYVG